VRGGREPLTLSHLARELGVFKRHGAGEGESELGADLLKLAGRASSHSPNPESQASLPLSSC
jgi:hypothetical protein